MSWVESMYSLVDVWMGEHVPEEWMNALGIVYIYSLVDVWMGALTCSGGHVWMSELGIVSVYGLVDGWMGAWTCSGAVDG